MKNRLPHFVLLGCLMVSFSAASLFAQEHSDQNRNRFQPPSFENESRAKWQKVDEVIEAFGLKEGQSIADIGGGSGYFSRPFAKKIGPKGVVYCCEIATNLMEYLQRRSLDEGLMNIVTVFAAKDRPMIPPKSVDHLFFCDTNHHLDNRVEYYKGLKPLLKPGGQIVVVDWKYERTGVGPGPGHAQTKEVVIDEFKQAGWKLKRDITEILEHQYFLLFVAAE